MSEICRVCVCLQTPRAHKKKTKGPIQRTRAPIFICTQKIRPFEIVCVMIGLTKYYLKNLENAQSFFQQLRVRDL